MLIELNSKQLKEDFPLLNLKNLVYLDNAATSQKPKQVIEAVKKYYEESNANIHRGVYQLSEQATTLYEEAREKAAKLINAGFEEIIFTSGATESINLVASSLDFKEGDEIIITEMEHHSNFVPWQQAAKEKKCVLKIARVDGQFNIDMHHLSSLITDRTRIVAVTHVSNVLGTVNDIHSIARLAHEKNALCLVDAAQSVPHMKVDVREIGCDFLAFSGHKMLGPTGTGVLYGKKEILEKMRPYQYGGGMIMEVAFENSKWNRLPWKFEAGTPNIAGTVGLSAAIDYISKIGIENIHKHELGLVQYALKKLREINTKIYGNPKLGVISFNIDDIHAHDVAEVLDKEGVAIRAGHHCAMPLMKSLGINACCRISFYLYNTREDIDRLILGLHKVREVFR